MLRFPSRIAVACAAVVLTVASMQALIVVPTAQAAMMRAPALA